MNERPRQAATRAEPPHIVVVGGGISGLAAAHELLAGAPTQSRRVTVLEAQQRLGGKIRTSPFAGRESVDEGADALLIRVPWAREFTEALGMADELVSPATGSAAVWWDGLQPIPQGLLLGLPTDLGQLARTKLLSWPAKLRAASEVLRPRTTIETDSIGAWVRARFGDQVHERLVDPLVGSIYAADTDLFSLTAVPQLAELAAGPRSVLLGSRQPRAMPTGPVFASPRGGMARLVEVAAQRIVELGGVIRTDTPCQTLERDGAGWRVNGTFADAVILACPAAQAARLLPTVGDSLAAIVYADVVLFTIAVPRADLPDSIQGLSGYLVPKPVQNLVTAVSFGSQKWSHWNVLADGSEADTVVLRISLGRDGLPVLHLSDELLLDAALTEVGHHLGVSLRPTATRISTWHRAFPQYRPHHHRLVAAIEEDLPPSLAIAGASYHGIGIPACIRSGRRAAASIADRVLSVVA
ncbi:MAG: protoporphyrinogen oxidase [Actinomycetota bacterium]